MAYTHNPGSGSAFKNEMKVKGDKLPYYIGTVMTPDGTECWIDQWVEETKDGKPYLSIKIKPKVEQPKPLQPETGEAEVISDDLSF